VKKPPNPRLQRTRSALLRSPLSRKPLGDRRVSCVLVVAFLCVGCAIPAQPTRQDLVGSWSVRHELGREDIELRPDGTFLQTLVDMSGQSRQLSGRWDLAKGHNGGSVVHLESAISFNDRIDRKTSLATAQPSSFDLYAVRDWGRLMLEFDPDLEGFRKAK